MSDRSLQDRLRGRLSAESNRLLDAMDELHDLEEQKREEPISTPAFHDLAETITAKARDVFRMTTIEEELGDRIDTGDVTLSDVDRESRGEPDAAAPHPSKADARRQPSR